MMHPRWSQSLLPRLAALAIFGAGALTGCSSYDEQVQQQASNQQEPNVHLYFLSANNALDDVQGVQYEVVCQDGTTISQYVDLEDEGLPPWLLPQGAGGAHAFADLLAVLPANQTCTVTVTPMQSPGVPSQDCSPATQTINVMPGVTQEIVLIMQCQGEPNGGIDVVGGLNHPPVITALGLAPSKFILACQDAIISPTIIDPDGDQVTTQVYIGNSPAGSQPTITLVGGQWVFHTDLPGQYEIKLVATDPFGATTAITFPIHVSPDDPNLCDPVDPTPLCCALPDGTVQTTTPDDCAAQGGAQTSPDLCNAICCAYDEVDARYVMPGQCDEGNVLPNADCEEVCCDIDFDGQGPYQMSWRSCWMQGGDYKNHGACVDTTCCELPDGSYSEVDVAQCANPASAQLCDQSPTCCLRPDSVVTSMTVSACVDLGGLPQDEGCEQCAVEPQGPGALSSCLAAPAAPTTDPWNIVKRVVWTDPDTVNPSQPFVATTPMIAPMADTNGDGVINDQDNAHIIVMGVGQDVNVIDAVTGQLRWSYGGLYHVQQPAVVDLGRDGKPEVLVIDAQGHLLAIDMLGQLIWQSAVPVGVGMTHTAPVIQPEDLDRDGRVEVVVGPMIFNGDTGALINTLPGQYFRGRVTLGDVDFDGITEVILAEGIYDPFTSALEVALPAPGTFALNQDALVQADLDPEPEVARIGGGQITIYDQDGSVLTGFAGAGYYSSWFGAPCAGDINGDGLTDIISVTNTAPGTGAGSLRVVATDVSGNNHFFQAWSSHLAWNSCAIADLNGDGLDEILLSGDGLRIFSNDPALLTPLAFEDTTIMPGQFDADNAYPTVADLDHDGASEIVAVWPRGTQNNGRFEVVIYEHAQDGWQDLGPSWQTFDYFPNRLSEDQSQTSPSSQAPWLIEGGAKQAKVVGASGIDLVAQIDGVCISSCGPGSQANVSVQLLNVGDLAASGPVTLNVYANVGGVPSGAPLASTTIAGPLAPASASAGVSLLVNVADIGPDGLIVAVDDANTTPECREGNNWTVWSQNPCD